jgi:competence protein ComEC
MLAPFGWLYVCFVVGVLVAPHAEIPSLLLPVAVVVAVLAAFRCRNFATAFAAQALLVVLIAHAIASDQERRNVTTLYLWTASHEDEVVRATGKVLRTPEISRDYFVLRVQVRSVAGTGIDGVARWTISGRADSYPVAGDIVEAFARFRLPSNFQAEGCFDYKQYLEREGIQVQSSVKNARLLRVVGHEASLASFISRLRLNLILQIINVLDARDSAVLRALWLDDRSTLDNETEQMLIDAGVFHVIAISGFHVAVLLGICFLILKRLIAYRKALVVLSAALLVYFLLLEGRSAITRSFLIFFLFAFASWRYEKISWSNVLFLSAFLQLVRHPAELWDPGYHLTYLSTAAIVFLAAPLCGRWRLRSRIGQIVLDFFVVSLTIQFVLAPYQALVFHKVPFASCAAGAFAVPLSSILIAAGPLLLPISFVYPHLLAFASPLVSLFFRTSALFSGVLLRVLPPPSFPLLVLFYGSLSAGLLLKRRIRRVFPAAVAVAFAGWLLVLFPVPPGPPEGLLVHFIDVGQGDAILLQYPDGTNDMIDTGGFWNIDALDIGTSVLLPYLTHWRVVRLHRVFITHPQADHMNGLITLQRYIPVEHLFISRLPPNAVLSGLLRSRITGRVSEIRRGGSFQQGDARIRVLAPWEASRGREVSNDDSLVLLLEYHGQKLLFSGDAEGEVEKKLLDSGDDLQADFLKVPHHGSKTSSSRPFLLKVRPKLAFISVGRHNWFHHPDRTVLDRYRSLHATILRTDRDGTIRLSVDQRKVETSTGWTSR